MYVMTEGQQRVPQAGRPHRVRSHVNAAAARAEVDGNANEVNLSHEGGVQG